MTWQPRARAWLRRLDHSMIFVLIAGTYTPFALLVLEETLREVVLIGGLERRRWRESCSRSSGSTRRSG